MKIIFKKKNGFTILEVLFAIVILSFSLSTIFVLLNNMFKIVSKVKSLSLSIDKSPIIFSSSSPLIHHKNIENYKSKFSSFNNYNKTSTFNEGSCSQLTTTHICAVQDNENILDKQYYSNIVFIPSKINQREKNE